MHQRQSKSQFLEHFLPGGGDLEVGVVHLVVLDRLLGATTKKVVNLFFGGGGAHPYKIMAMSMNVIM